MRNWGVVISGFYVLALATLSPVVMALIRSIDDTGAMSRLPNAYSAEWYAWAWIAVLALGPLVLLLVHADIDRKRLRLRRHVAVSAAAAGLALSLLVLMVVTSILAVLQGDDWADGEVWIALASWPTAWVVWTVVLWRMGERLLDPATRVHRWLVRGSVLELLVVVPAYLIVRQRHECTAPEVTAFGIATGLAILLMSVGPGTWFLYRAGLRRLRGGPDPRPHG